MNKLILFFCMLGGMSFQHSTSIDYSVPSDGLVAYYSFNDCDAYDDSGKQSNGKIYGNGICRCGVDGNGIYLNGKTDYIEFGGPVNKYFTTSDFTLSFYFKPTGNTIFRQSLVSKGSSCGQEHVLDILLDQNNNAVQTDFIQEEFIEFDDLSAVLQSGDWYHYALVRRGVRAYTYINGNLMNEARRCSGVDIANDTPLSIGNSPCVGKGARRFEGVVDELRVYEKPFSHAEIMGLYMRNKVEDAERDCVS